MSSRFSRSAACCRRYGLRVADSRVVARVHGWVQGVGFRAWVRRLLAELDLEGSATNLADGTVEVIASGDRASLARLLATIEGRDAPGSVTRVDVTWQDPPG